MSLEPLCSDFTSYEVITASAYAPSGQTTVPPVRSTPAGM